MSEQIALNKWTVTHVDSATIDLQLAFATNVSQCHLLSCILTVRLGHSRDGTCDTVSTLLVRFGPV